MEATSPGSKDAHLGVTWSIFDNFFIDGPDSVARGSARDGIEGENAISNSGEAIVPRSLGTPLELFWQIAFSNSSSGMGSDPYPGVHPISSSYTNVSGLGKSLPNVDSPLVRLGINLETAAGTLFDLQRNESMYSSNYNSTGLQDADVGLDIGGVGEGRSWDELWRGIPLGIVLAFLCLLTTIGNIMVLHAVRTEKRLQTVSNLFIVSLAVADMIVGIIVMPMSAAYIFTERWLMGVAVCQIWIGVDYTASTASILNLFILSLDRYWSVRQPLKYLHKRTKRRALSMIAVVWVISSLWIIPISSWHYFAHGGVRTVPHDECDTEYAKNSLFKVITAFFNFYLPLSVMFILYFRIFIAIRKRSKFELGHRYPGGTVISFKSSNNVAAMHSIDDSDFINDEDEGRKNHNSFHHSHRLHAEEHHGRPRSRQNGTRNTVPNGCRHLRVMAATCSVGGRGTSGNSGRGGRGRGGNCGGIRGSRGGGGVNKRRDLTPSSASRFKVEYIYDENVLDPQTEKIERYFYEDSYPLSRLNRARWTSSNPNNDSKPSALSASTSSSSSSTFPCSSQHSVRFHSNLRPVNETKSSQRLSASSTPYCSAYSDTENTYEYHHPQHTSRQQQQQQQQHEKLGPPREQFLTVGGKTTAVVKRNLFKRQKKLDEDPSSKGGKSNNDKPRSRLKLEAFRKHKPAETSFSPNLTVNVSSSFSSSSASTFGDSVEGKWGVDHASGSHGGNAESGRGGCGNGRGDNGSLRNCRSGGISSVLIDDQIRSEALNANNTTDRTALSRSSSFPEDCGLRIHRGKDLSCGNLNARVVTTNTSNGNGQSRLDAPSNSKTGLNSCCGCRRTRNGNDDDDEDDDDDELSSFSLNTRSDSKNRRLTGSTGVGGGGERGGGAAGATSSGSVSGGVSGLKERLRTMRQSSSLNKEIKAARQLGVIMGAFTLCFLPYFVLFLVVAFCDDCVSPAHLTTATWVGYLNSTLNPFLYPLCNANFRTKFRSMLSCCGKERGGAGRNGGRLGPRRRNHDFARASVYNSRYD